MRHLGAAGAGVTRLSSDGGIDAESADYLSQVKNYSGPVGVQEVRQLAGVAAADGRRPLFFAASGYTTSALEYGDRTAIGLVVYDAIARTLQGVNAAGQRYRTHGLRA